MRNGVAELIKISTVEHGEAFELLEKHTEDLINYKFGYVEGAPAGLKEASDSANWKSLHFSAKRLQAKQRFFLATVSRLRSFGY